MRIKYQPAVSMVASAQSCTQQVTYSCNKTSGGVVTVYDKDTPFPAPMVGTSCTGGGSCTCKNDGSAVANEVETFNDQGKLPISKIQVAQMTTLDQKIHIKVGDVICNEGKSFIIRTTQSNAQYAPPQGLLGIFRCSVYVRCYVYFILGSLKFGRHCL